MIESILINTYNADPALRHAAEASLHQILRQHNSLAAFLGFMQERNNHRDLRLAAAIAIKNKAREYWRDDKLSPDGFTISDEEKGHVRGIIVDVLLTETDNAIRGLLSDTMKVYAEFDYPERWPALLPRLVAAITQQADILQMFNALAALRKLVKKFEYKPKEARAPLDEIIHATFPHLLRIASTVFAQNTLALEAAQIIKMILKIFWSSVMYALPLSAQGLDVPAWFQLLIHVLEMNLETLEGDKEALTLNPWWKAKKWSGRLMCQFIQRYGNPRYAGDEYTTFANYFKSTIATQLLGPIMNTLLKKSSGVFVTDTVHRMCLSYTASAVEMSPSYKVMKPHLDFLLFSVIFPTLCLSPEDIELFNDDPVEFVRKINNPVEDWADPRIAAINLLQMLARYRQKDTLPRFMPFLTRVLTEYAMAPQTEAACIKKDGVLVAVATIQKILMESRTYAAQVEPFLVLHVIPEFQSPVAFLRARACWAIEYFDESLWEKESHMTAVVGGLLKGLRDPALPVQSAAACSMRTLIELEGAMDLMRPMLADIVMEYFRIMDEVENDSILSALQSIVLKFGEEIQGLAPMMVEKLISVFDGFCQVQDDDDDEAAFAASQCLDTIAAVIEAVENVPSALTSIEPLLVNLILRILQDNSGNFFDYIDNATQLLSFLTYFNDDMSPLLFSMCGPLIAALHDKATDFISEFAAPVLNFITKSTDAFFSSSFPDGSSFAARLLGVIDKVLASEVEGNVYDNDPKTAFTVLTCLVTAGHGRLHEHIGRILSLVIARLQKPIKSMRLKYVVLDAGLAVIHYDPLFAMSALKEANEAPSALFFNILFDSLPGMEQSLSRRLIVVAFTCLLSLPVSALPAIVSSNLDAMFKQCIRELVFIGEEEDAMDEEEDGGDDDEEADHGPNKWAVARDKLDVPEGGYDEDEDCLNAEDEAYRESLEQLAKEDRSGKVYRDGYLVDDEDDDCEVFDYTSPLENIDILGYFFGGMTAVTAREPALIARLQAALDAEDKQRLQELMQAQQEKAAAAAAGGQD